MTQPNASAHLVDDDVRLRYLKSQRNMRVAHHAEATDEPFVPEDIEKNMQIFSRLANEGAFEEWLNLGIPTTIRSKAQEAAASSGDGTDTEDSTAEGPECDPDSWDAVRTLLSQKIGRRKKIVREDALATEDSCATPPPLQEDPNAADNFAFAVDVSSRTLRALEAKLNDAALRSTERNTIIELRDSMETFVSDISSLIESSQGFIQPTMWDQFDPSPMFMGKDLEAKAHLYVTSTEEMSESFVSAIFDLDAVRLRLLEAQATSRAAALEREHLLARVVKMEDLLHEITELSLRINFLSASYELFQRIAPMTLSTLRQYHEDIYQLLDAIAAQSFKAQKASAESSQLRISSLIEASVNDINSLLVIPFAVSAHRQWQSQLASFAFDNVYGSCAAFLSLTMTADSAQCTREIVANRIKTWICVDGVAPAEVSFRLLKNDSLRTGLSLCISARKILSELDRTYDAEWGFRYW